jgi:hypothetical protein
MVVPTFGSCVLDRELQRLYFALKREVSAFE